MSSYHGWTHRPKALGGTDPVTFDVPQITAAFFLHTAAAQQPIESVRTWVPVILEDDSTALYNWDLLTGGTAVEVINDADLTPGDRIVFTNAEDTGVNHYWVVGATIGIGANEDDVTYPAVDVTAYGLNAYPVIMGARIAPSDDNSDSVFPQTKQYAIPRLGTDFSADYYYFFVHADAGADSEPFMTFNLSGAFPGTAVSHDPGAGADRVGLQLQVLQGIEIVPDAIAVPPVDWPAVHQGHVWGHRYAIGDGLTY